jgi:hypothetical protein
VGAIRCNHDANHGILYARIFWLLFNHDMQDPIQLTHVYDFESVPSQQYNV